jgi:hypothetical protein
MTPPRPSLACSYREAWDAFEVAGRCDGGASVCGRCESRWARTRSAGVPGSARSPCTAIGRPRRRPGNGGPRAQSCCGRPVARDRASPWPACCGSGWPPITGGDRQRWPVTGRRSVSWPATGSVPGGRSTSARPCCPRRSPRGGRMAGRTPRCGRGSGRCARRWDGLMSSGSWTGTRWTACGDHRSPGCGCTPRSNRSAPSSTTPNSRSPRQQPRDPVSRPRRGCTALNRFFHAGLAPQDQDGALSTLAAQDPGCGLGRGRGVHR